MIPQMHAKYCPFCQRNIEPYVDDDGEEILTVDGGFIYAHDDVPHDDDYDFKGLQ